MTKTYTQLLKQIEGLKAEAEKLRRKEVAGVVVRIRDAIDHYGLSAADLGLGPVKGKPVVAAKRIKRGAAKSAVGSAAASAAPKYRGEAGQVWGGRGPRPKWLREAIAAGRKLEDFSAG